MASKFSVDVVAKLKTDKQSVRDAMNEIAKMTGENVDYLAKQNKILATIYDKEGKIHKITVTNNSVQEQTIINNTKEYQLRTQISNRMAEIQRQMAEINSAEYKINLTAADRLKIEKEIKALQNTDTSGYKAEELADYNNKLKNLQDLLKQGVSTYKQEDTLRKQINQRAQELQRKLSLVNTEESNIKMTEEDRLNIMGRLNELMSQDLTKLDASQLQEYNTELKNLQDLFNASKIKADSFGNSIQKIVDRFVSWYTVVKVLKYSIETISDLDKSLTELNKVANVSQSRLDTFTEQAYELGKTVGRTTKDVVDATTEFVKSGYDLADSSKLGQIALLYANIADEEVSAGDAASFIISQLKAFNIEADDAISVVNALNEVSNNYAVSSADLADSIGNVSATMAASGTTYQETLRLNHSNGGNHS